MKSLKTALDSCAITVGSSKPFGSGLPWASRSREMSVGSTYRRPIWRASTMMLSSIVIAMVPSSSSVVAAFLLLGLRKAGTPLEIASTPVSAALAGGERPREQEDQGQPRQVRWL